MSAKMITISSRRITIATLLCALQTIRQTSAVYYEPQPVEKASYDYRGQVFQSNYEKC